MTLLPRHCSAGLMGGGLARYIWFLAFWGCFGYTCFSALEDAGFQVLEPLMPAKSFAGGELTRYCVPQAQGCKTWRDYPSSMRRGHFPVIVDPGHLHIALLSQDRTLC